MKRRHFFRTIGAAVSLPLVASGRGSATGESTSAQTPYEPLGTIDIPGAREATVHDDGDSAYVAVRDGFVSVDISDPENPTLLAERRGVESTDGSSMRGVYDLWAWNDRLIVPGPAQPLPASAQGFALFDISEPADPQKLAWYGTDHYIHNCYFEDGIIYLTGSGLPTNPLIMIDIADDNPTELGRWSLVDHESEWKNTALSGRVLHDVYVQNGVAYLPYWDSGTWVVDVSDPTDPTVRSRVGDYSLAELTEFSASEARREAFIPGGNAHYAQPDEEGEILAVGKEAWAATGPGTDGEQIGGPGGIDLWDISNKDSPEKFAHIEAPESYDNTQSGWFTTAHNVDIVGDRLYASWYYGGVTVHDISTPSEPERMVWWRDPTETCFWTAQSVTAGEAFLGSSIKLGPGFNAPNETTPGLYLFPDEAGKQADPPNLVAGPPAEPTETQTSTPEATATPTTTPTEEPSTAPTSTTVREQETTGADDDGPGFGIAGAVTGIGGLAYTLARHSDGSSSEE
ncbi:hypothetical protein ACFQJ7_05285 [Halovenus rubra]|uniref:LVIVD repeat-containing protein n=2 Tax=Halovenus rubra TaxID=869890 RepID=A0ABD5X2N9_9EURY|nr:hypothetical protein [Halovenus rubra]